MPCSLKNTKSDSKHSIAIANKPLFIPFDLCADLTQIIYDLAYSVKTYRTVDINNQLPCATTSD